MQCEWPKMVKNQVQEGVSYFVRESKLKAIEYAKKTFAYDFYVKVIFLLKFLNSFRLKELNKLMIL